jgi:hypothetical protein
MRGLVRRCCGDIVQFTDEDIMFVSSLSTFDGYSERFFVLWYRHLRVTDGLSGTWRKGEL